MHTTDETAKTLTHLITLYQTAVRSGDVDGYTALFAEDAIQMPPGAADRFGRSEIHAGMKPGLTQNKMDVTLATHEMFALGPGQASVRVTVTGTRTPNDGGTPAPIRYSALFLFRESGRGDWKIHQQIWNVKN